MTYDILWKNVKIGAFDVLLFSCMKFFESYELGDLFQMLTLRRECCAQLCSNKQKELE